MRVEEALMRIIGGVNLTAEEAERVMSNLMLGEVHHGVIGGFLVGMQVKGVTGEELAGFARGMRRQAVQFDFGVGNLVDTCGTGGGRATFNLSTGAAILAAACGAKVAKHGNRAVTSKCGSADVLEALGVPIEGNLDEQKKRLADTGLVFLYAPSHHPAVRHVAPVRKALGVRTYFNLLGPLANPAGAKRQMIGVFDVRNLDVVAKALQILGAEHAFVVHGQDGMDEVSPCAGTDYREVKGSEISAGVWRPSDFGMEALAPADLDHGDGIAENAEILREALTESASVKSAALIPNTAVTLVLAGVASSVSEGADLARAAVASGEAGRLLDRLAAR
ncbi:anthranilate phosphoribosyltransferase [Armatimonadetes bacterium Uphvl-Ar1]|nr:anthranilate phosphoribosyltransferase [Armatimonadetes bacterium Uphvl-Ar1]